MLVPWDKPFPLVPCGDLDLWSTLRSNLLPGGGPQFFEFACLMCFLYLFCRATVRRTSLYWPSIPWSPPSRTSGEWCGTETAPLLCYCHKWMGRSVWVLLTGQYWGQYHISTIEDFWRMVWDRNSSVIVLLSQVDGEVSMTIVNRSILRSILLLSTIEDC